MKITEPSAWDYSYQGNHMIVFLWYNEYVHQAHKKGQP